MTKRKEGTPGDAMRNMFYLLRTCMTQGHVLHTKFGATKPHFETDMEFDDGSYWKCKAWKVSRKEAEAK